MSKNEIKISKSSLSSNMGSQTVNEIKKNNFYQKEAFINLNNNIHIHNIPKNKSISSNHLYDSIVDDTKSKSSVIITKHKKKEKSDLHKNKKRNKDKLSKLLKNEKSKIPTGKRMTIAQNSSKLNLNNFKDILNSYTPPKEVNMRTDKNGVEIKKSNKKLVHITFIDEIPPYKFTETVNIQSFKQFNIVEKLPEEQLELPKCSKCCNIF